MYRTFVIVRHTFREAVAQPIYSLLIGLGAAILIIFAVLPFFTFGEDTVMFMSVGLDVILLFVLIATLFATSKSIFDEIEDRTMLTLMSKPVQRWEVLVGKYLGIILSALVAITILGGVLCIATWLRIPGDYTITPRSTAETEFLAIGAGAHAWLLEAAAAGTARMNVKMAEALALAKISGTARVDEALGQAATYGRYATGDLASLLSAGGTRPPARTGLPPAQMAVAS